MPFAGFQEGLAPDQIGAAGVEPASGAYKVPALTVVLRANVWCLETIRTSTKQLLRLPPLPLGYEGAGAAARICTEGLRTTNAALCWLSYSGVPRKTKNEKRKSLHRHPNYVLRFTPVVPARGIEPLTFSM